MRGLQACFPAPVDIIGEGEPSRASDVRLPDVRDAEILALLGRRPCTLQDVAAGLGMHANDALKHLDRLVAQGATRTVYAEKKCFYTAGGKRRKMKVES